MQHAKTAALALVVLGFWGVQAAHGGTMRERAAAELATEDSELTDLREVYGDWGKEVASPAAGTDCPALDKREIREALEAIMETEYCGDALMDGLGVDAMLRGEAPTEGKGVVNVGGSDWQPVLLEMMEEEIERCNAASVGQVARLREVNEAMAKADLILHPELRDHWSGVSWEARMAVDEVTGRLRRMLPLLENADGRRADVLAMWERLWRECPPEYGFVELAVAAAWVENTLARKDMARCLELGRWCRTRGGVDTPEHLAFCVELCEHLRDCTEDDLKEAATYLLSAADDMHHYVLGANLDWSMEEHLPGWKGSLQRRRFAERLVWRGKPGTGGLVCRWDENGALVRMTSDELLPWQARHELAADESELTDLREVYGDWGKGDGDE